MQKVGDIMLSNEELKQICGGATSFWNSTLFNAVARTISTISELGRTLGTSVRMIFSRKVCN